MKKKKKKDRIITSSEVSAEGPRFLRPWYPTGEERAGEGGMGGDGGGSGGGGVKHEIRRVEVFAGLYRPAQQVQMQTKEQTA